MQTIFLTAASGNIGAQLIPSLLRTEPDIHLVLPTTQASKLAHFAEDNRVTTVEGSLADPQWLEAQLVKHSIDTVFICLFGTDELLVVFNFLNAIQRSPGVKHVVYLSACGDFLGKPDELVGWLCPHTKVKPPVEKALRHMKGITHTVIGPTLFFENVSKVKGAVTKGRRWVEPFGKLGAAQVAVEDVADAVKIAILDRGRKWDGKKINVGTLKQYTSEECATLWSKALGYTIEAVPSNEESLDQLEQQLRGELGPMWARDIKLLYAGIILTGFGMSEAEYATQVAFLGREPAKYEEFVTKIAAEWTQSVGNAA